MRIRNIVAVSTVLAIASMIGASSAAAQSQSLRAHIPFEFRAAGELFPVGTYILTKVNPTTLRLQDAKGKGVFILANLESARMNDGNWYVFHQYGNQSFLAGAYWSGASVSLKIPKSRAELEVAKTANTLSRPASITIAAK